MRAIGCAVACASAAALLALPARAEEPRVPPAPPAEQPAELAPEAEKPVWHVPESEPPAAPAKRERSSGETAQLVLAYLPNRVFDLCDLVRLRARIGSGWAVGARVTRFAPVFAGSYKSMWVGLRGPRGRPRLPLPIGLEGQTGVEIGPAQVTSRWNPPEYGLGEVGAGVHVWIVGVDAGFDFVELADFLAGFALIDLSHDDF